MLVGSILFDAIRMFLNVKFSTRFKKLIICVFHATCEFEFAAVCRCVAVLGYAIARG